jgi:hypothetical protein
MTIFFFQNRLIQTSQTGGQQYSDISPFSIPCLIYWPKPSGKTQPLNQGEEEEARVLVLGNHL